MIMPILKILSLATLSFLFTLLWTPALAHFLYKNKLKKTIRQNADTPIYTKMHKHKEGTPTMGGILIWGTMLVFALLFFYLSRFEGLGFFRELNFLSRKETLLPLGALFAASLVGLIDDVLTIKGFGAHELGIRFRYKFIFYTLIASFGAWWFFDKLEWDIVRVPFVDNFNLGLWFIPFFVLTIIGTSFAVNETDGLDGLAGGVLLTSFAAFSVLAFTQGRYDLAAFCGVIIGALLAFLWFNIPPARFFMGDTGAMGLGTTLGIIAFYTNSVLLLPVIGLPLVIEAGSYIAQFASKKLFNKKLFLSSPLHHHLEAKGWPEPKVVMRFWVVSLVSAILGLIIALLDQR